MPPSRIDRPEGIFGGHNCHRSIRYVVLRRPRPRKRVRGHDFIRFGRSKAETGRRPVADERQGPAAPAETKQTRRGRVTRSPRFPAPTPPRQRVHSAERQEEVIPCARGPRKPWIRTTARLPTRATCKCRCGWCGECNGRSSRIFLMVSCSCVRYLNLKKRKSVSSRVSTILLLV